MATHWIKKIYEFIKTRRHLLVILLVGLSVRFFASLTSIGFEHPNEVYRTLEWLSFKRGYTARIPWEWKESLLSIWSVSVASLFLNILEFFSITNTKLLSVGIRIGYSFLSLGFILASYVWLKWIGLNSKQTLWITFICAIFPEVVYRSVRIMDYSLELSILSWAVLFLLYSSKYKKLSPLLSGILLGFCFFIRFQSVLYFLALLGFILLNESLKNKKITFTLGYFLALIGFATLEVILTGQPFLNSFIKYIDFNMFQSGASKIYGVQPWHRYITESFKYLGWFLCIGLFLIDVKNKKVFWSFVLIVFFPILIHSFLGHKEARFIFGVLPWAIPMMLAVLALRIKRVQMVCLFAVISVCLSLWRQRELWYLNADLVQTWSEESYKETGKIRHMAGDPDFKPGSFFLRTHDVVCYPAIEKCE